MRISCHSAPSWGIESGMREEAEYLYQIFVKGNFNSFLSPLLFSNKTLISYRTHGIYVSFFSFLLFSFFSEGPKIVEYLLTF
uniref:ORF81a n=1 Tax=Pinus koraiensis TaxID=88728 RepID=Q85X69_PINKO|nr:ORF81a [Pinus koraiensis]